jgi:predicted nucleic acid-binding protein
VPEVVAVAIRYSLSSYDAGYLWLAMVKSLPLLTLDKKLGTAYQLALKESA